MKLIRSGGVNARLNETDDNYHHYGFGNYFMRQIKPELDELMSHDRKIAICVAAKPDTHGYDPYLLDLGFDLDKLTILGREDGAEWSQYAAILMLGGETKALYAWLKKTRFNPASLKNCHILAGDSAGAYVLSAKTLITYAPDGSTFEIVDGFLPGLPQLIAGHSNNPHYHKPGLTVALRKWCETNSVEYIGLQENEINITVASVGMLQ